MMSVHDDPDIAKLLKGIQNFQTRFYEQNPERMQDLAEHGQKPKTLLIACCDSRVDPAILTGALPGELFVIRNVANLVPPYVTDNRYDGARAAIEYAVRDLEVSHVVVLGHAQCGGIKALLGSLSGKRLERDFIGSWVSMALDASFKFILHPEGKQADQRAEMEVTELDVSTLCQHQHLVERAAIRGSLDNLMSYPWIRDRVESGSVKLHGWWFDIETGDLWCTDAENRSFLPMIE
jgi:carbonic anhydrase